MTSLFRPSSASWSRVLLFEFFIRHRLREGAFRAPQRQSHRAVEDDRDYGNPHESCKQEAGPEIHNRFDHWHNPH